MLLIFFFFCLQHGESQTSLRIFRSFVTNEKCIKTQLLIENKSLISTSHLEVYGKIITNNKCYILCIMYSL